MKNSINKTIFTKDGWPLEQIIGRPVFNFIRRLLHGKEVKCRDCWLMGQAQKSSNSNSPMTQPLNPI